MTLHAYHPVRAVSYRAHCMLSFFVMTGAPKKHFFSRRIFLASASVFFLAGGAFSLWSASLRVPDFGSFEERKVEESTRIYDRTGEILLSNVHQDIRRTVVPISDISPYVRDATIAIEDAEFYTHAGIRPLSILRAVFINILKGGFSQGGSTITQQVVKNALLTQEKTIARKLKEWVLSIKLERAMTKDEILALYLNEAPYGGTLYGAEEASRAFFGKRALELTLSESAYLAALPQAPTYYSPYGNRRDKLDERKNLVLSRMKEEKFITEEEYEVARKETILFLPPEDGGIKAPHFVFYVRSYLEDKYGKDAVEKGGLRVITTLDWDLEQKAEEIVKKYALENEKNFNAENAALVATDPNTGQILVMVGSRDYFDAGIDGNFNVAIAERQPGSAFKPFVYANAFRKGYTPETVVFDVPTQFDTNCDPAGTPIFSETGEEKCYTPVNYDGKYRGPVSLRDALAQSINIPAIKVLYLAGLKDSLELAKDFGLATLASSDRYGLTLVLGGGEVSPLDMTNAYGVFANDGVFRPHTPILRVEDKDGNILEEFTERSGRIIPETVARQISNILSDNTARTPAFGAASALYFSTRQVAVKTGTTNDYKDAWIIGYTPSLSAGAWAGNNDNTPMEKKVAGFIVAPLWHEFMEYALSRIPDERFLTPPEPEKNIKPILRGVWEGNEVYEVDSVSGGLATEYTPEETRVTRAVTNVRSILQWVDARDPRGPIPERPENDPQYRLWEYGVRKWAFENGFVDGNRSHIPVFMDVLHTPASRPRISIITPASGARFSKNERVFVSLSVQSAYQAKKAELFFDGIFIGSSFPPFSFSFIPGDFGIGAGEHEITAAVTDSVSNKSEERRMIIITE